MIYAADKHQFRSYSLAQLEGVPTNPGELAHLARGATYWADEAAKARDAGNADLWRHFVSNAIGCRIALEGCKSVIAERRAAGEINYGIGR